MLRRLRPQSLLALALVATLALLALIAPGCLAPTLPLPPPEAPDLVEQSADDPKVWDVGGTATPGAIVTVVNTRTGRGAVAEDRANSGRYRVEIEAERCDVATIKQEVEGDESSLRSFVITPTQGGKPDPSCD